MAADSELELRRMAAGIAIAPAQSPVPGDLVPGASARALGTDNRRTLRQVALAAQAAHGGCSRAPAS